MHSRRSFLAGLGAAALAGAGVGCSRPGGEPGVLRLGFLSNVTHAPVLAGIESGRIARALGQTRLETRVFRAGPRVLEALMGRAIDVGFSGPAPVVITHARHGAGVLRVLTGCASGGASLVAVRGIEKPEDLRKNQVAVTQLGSTQDVALRTYLAAHGLAPKERGGDVTIHALAGATIRAEMAAGHIKAAWMPEGWASRLVGEGATRLVDERDLWENKAFSTAIAVTKSDFLTARATDVERLIAAIHDEVRHALASPAEAQNETYAQIKRLTGNPGPREYFREAWRRIDFTIDPLPAAVQRFAEDATALGMIPRVACAPLFAR